LKHTPQKSLKRLAQETGISKSSTAKSAKLHKLQLYMATAVSALQPHEPASSINFCNWGLQLFHDEKFTLI
jgi:hypothetical protein